MLARLRTAILGLLALAAGIRVAWVLIEPAIPGLIVLAAVAIFLAMLFRRSE